MKKKLTYYALASTHRVREHGGGFDEQHITRMGSYNTGDFPPLFATEKEAMTYVEENNILGIEIVPMIVHEKE